MNRATLNLWVGIFVIGGFVAILFLAFKVGSISGSSKCGGPSLRSG